MKVVCLPTVGSFIAFHILSFHASIVFTSRRLFYGLRRTNVIRNSNELCPTSIMILQKCVEKIENNNCCPLTGDCPGVYPTHEVLLRCFPSTLLGYVVQPEHDRRPAHHTVNMNEPSSPVIGSSRQPTAAVDVFAEGERGASVSCPDASSPATCPIAF